MSSGRTLCATLLLLAPLAWACEPTSRPLPSPTEETNEPPFTWSGVEGRDGDVYVARGSVTSLSDHDTLLVEPRLFESKASGHSELHTGFLCDSLVDGRPAGDHTLALPPRAVMAYYVSATYYRTSSYQLAWASGH